MENDTLKDAIGEFKLCVDNESEQRKESLDDLKFACLGEQWPEEVVRQRDLEGRPYLTINRLPAFIRQVTNDARQNRPSINVHPVDSGADKQTAEILNGLIRNIQNVSRSDIAYDTALEFAVTMGFGYWIIRDEYSCDDSFDKDLIIERVSNPFSVYGDYQSRDATSADWNRAFVTDLYTEVAFKKRWTEAQFSNFEGLDEASQLWFIDKKIRVAEYWTRDEILKKLLKLSDGTVMHEEEYLRVSSDGPSLKDLLDVQGVVVEGDRMTRSYKVIQRIVSGSEVLETNEWKGKYIPIVPVYGNEINIDGKRYFQSLVRFAKDPARMFNYWRTASTELVALAPKAPWVGAVGQFATDSKWATANSATHEYLEYDNIDGAAPPQRLPFSGVPAGALQEALNASDDMKNIMGLHDASLGARSNETSGRAIMARQREGDVSTFHFMDNQTRAIEHTGVILVDLIPKHYDVARIIRCIKEDGSTYPVPINQNVQPAPPQEGQQQMPGQMQEQWQPAPQEIPGVTRVFNLTNGKYDVTVATGPSFTTKRQEASESMMAFVQALPMAGAVTADLIAKSQDWPNADEFAARLKAAMPPNVTGAGLPPEVQQQQQQMQQQMQQMAQQLNQLSQENQQQKLALADKSQQNALKAQENELKARDLQIKEDDSRTKNLVAQTEAQAMHTQQVVIPQMQHQDASQAIGAAVEHLAGLAESLKQKPMRKQARAVKQGDGSYMLESLEIPEGMQ